MADFFSEFNAVSTQDWQKSVEKVLKGQSIETLNWQYDATLNLAPLYRESASSATIPSLQNKNSNAWDILITLVQKDYASAQALNAAALHHLAHGATELNFVLEEVADIAVILKGIWLDMVRLSFEVEDENAAKQLLKDLALVAQDKLMSGQLVVRHSNMQALHTLIEENAKLPFSKYSFFEIKISSDKTSLARNLAKAIEEIVAWLKYCKAQGQAYASAIAQVQVCFEIQDAYFVEIAKIRAFKRLWLAVLAYLEMEDVVFPRLVAYTSSVNYLDDRGAYSLLAATSQALSAVIAGVDALCVRPPKTWEGIAEETAERLARNVHFILLQESHLDAVVDPAAGSYYIEAATAQLTSTAWDLCAL